MWRVIVCVCFGVETQENHNEDARIRHKYQNILFFMSDFESCVRAIFKWGEEEYANSFSYLWQAGSFDELLLYPSFALVDVFVEV